jgi:hypothetical protein
MTMLTSSVVQNLPGRRPLARLRRDRRVTTAATSCLDPAIRRVPPTLPSCLPRLFGFPLMFLSFIMETTLQQFAKTKKPTVGFLIRFFLDGPGGW